MITFILAWVGGALGALFINYVLHYNNPRWDEEIDTSLDDVVGYNGEKVND